MTPIELKRDRINKLIQTKNHNREEFYRFFVELYKAEEDPHAPISIAEEFGPDVPDVRKPGQTLEELFPHYIICKTDPKEPDYADYQPDSPLYKAEFEKLVELTKRVRRRADEINERARRICELQSQGVN